MTKKEKKLVGRLDEQSSRGCTPRNVSRSVAIAFPLLLVLATLIPYWQTASFGFVNFDDPNYVSENPLLQDGLDSGRIKEAVFGFHKANWHPLVWLSYMAEIEVFGTDPGVMHITNVVLHIANSLLVYAWLCRSTGDASRSLLAGLIFALHPMHVESVAWVTERKDVLSTLLLMATLVAYTEYAVRKSRGWYAGALLLFAIGLTAKGMLVTVPVILLLLDIWPLRRFQPFSEEPSHRAVVRSTVVDKIPFIILSIAVSMITILAQQSAGAVAGIEALSILERVENSLVSYLRYIFKTVWPVHLCAFYPMPKGGWPVGIVIASAISFVAITWAVWRVRRRKAAMLIGWCWFAVTLLPVIGIIQVGSQSMADRYMYVPMIGLSVMLLWGLPESRLRNPHGAVATSGVLIVILLILTTQQVGTWRDSIVLFENAVLVAPENNFTARSNLGIAYTDADRFEDAEEQFTAALKLNPNDAGCLSNLARNYNRAGNYTRTESLLTSAVQVLPNEPQLWLHLGNAMRGMERLDAALAGYQEAVRLKPDYSEALHNIGMVVSRNNSSDGMQYFRRALEADRTNAVAWNSLGNSLVRAGELQSAEQSYLEAIRLADLEESKKNLEYVRELSRQASPRK
jgi:Flp pilus assembly protein TadD